MDAPTLPLICLMERYWIAQPTLPMPYRNPVYSREFADPFVLKYRGSYWAYSTGFQPDGRVFGILRSDDLAHWDPSGGAMEPLPGGHTCYWAPEVTYEDDGAFLMYYSVGNEEHMVIRVARAEHPAGPFFDLGVELTKEPFAIDAHVFKDDDGSRYLFYATDFLTHTHIGTGTVVAKMKDPFSLAGDPTPVSRAKYDWQVYDPNRESKGGVRWHTVEGPFVLKRKGLYYQMFSGGNWQNISYGVSYATSDSVVTADEWEQHADGQKLLPILRTLPGKVLGPGHNSVVRGPNNRDLYCVYHQWVSGERVLAIDRLDWCGRDMILLGPPTEEQAGPFAPKVEKAADEPDGALAKLFKLPLGSPSVLIKFSVLLQSSGSLEIALEAADGAQLYQERLEASGALLPNVWHNVRLEIDSRALNIRVGESVVRTSLTLAAEAAELHLRPSGAPRISTIQLTRGWEDLFFPESEEYLDEHGWQTYTPERFGVMEKELRSHAPDESATLVKALGVSGDLEIVINVRVGAADARDASAEIILGPADDETVLLLAASGTSEVTRVLQGSRMVAEETLATPPGVYHQFRLLLLDGVAQIAVDGSLLCRTTCTAGQQLAIRVTGDAAFDMMRVTEISA